MIASRIRYHYTISATVVHNFKTVAVKSELGISLKNLSQGEPLGGVGWGENDFIFYDALE